MTYETFQQHDFRYAWRLVGADGAVVVESLPFPTEAEAAKNAWRVASGLTECLNVTEASASAPSWLYDAMAKMRAGKPEAYAVLTTAAGTVLDVLVNEFGDELPLELRANVERMLKGGGES
jgi:hypothetical protein